MAIFRGEILNMNKIEIEEFKDSKKIKHEQGKINFYSISSKNEFTKIKSDLEKILEPTKLHVINKKENNMYDDWDEYEHDKIKYNNLLKKIEDGEDLEINIFCAEINGKIIGHVFMVRGEQYIRDFLNRINYKKNIKNVEQYAVVEAFVIQKEYRGIGFKMIYDHTLPNILKNGVKKILVSSSHAKAFAAYDRAGEIIYEGFHLSDHKIYYRLSKRWLIDIEKLEVGIRNGRNI